MTTQNTTQPAAGNAPQEALAIALSAHSKTHEQLAAVTRQRDELLALLLDVSGMSYQRPTEPIGDYHMNYKLMDRIRAAIARAEEGRGGE